MLRSRVAVSLAIAFGFLGTAQAQPIRADGDAKVRSAVERSLPFLLEGGETWRLGKAKGQNDRVCASCHQIPFTIWSHNEAKRAGVAIEQKRLDDLTTWTLDWCVEQKHPKTQAHTGGFLSTMQQLIMGRDRSAANKDAIAAYSLFGRVIGSMQQDAGFWREGNQIHGKGTSAEADETDTMWIVLGLASLEKIDAVPQDVRHASAKHRERALAWLADKKPGNRSDWLALRMLVEREFGDSKKVSTWKEHLLAQQNDDGGWPFLKGERSHPLVTGQTLYALAITGENSESKSIAGGRGYLVETQEKDGSWKAISRNEAGKTNAVTIHWGTAWAAMGLTRTLPPHPAPQR